MHFLFTAGSWKGTGSVMFSHSPEVLTFTTKWTISGNDRHFDARQEVVIEDLMPMVNSYVIDVPIHEKFTLNLTNEVVGTFSGHGVFNERKIAWEFTHPGLFDGFEVYERVSDTEYLFHAEYTGGDGYINKIYGSMKKE